MANAFQTTAFQLTGGADQSSTTSAGTVTLVGGTHVTSRVGQSFVPTITAITNVAMLLFQTGTPTDNTIMEIQTDATNLPSGTVVGSSPSTPTANLSTDTAGVWVPLVVTASVTAGVKYWVVVRRDVGGAGDSSNAPRVRYSVSNPYASGGYSVFNGTTSVWSAESATVDVAFIVAGNPATGPFQAAVTSKGSSARQTRQAVHRASVW